MGGQLGAMVLILGWGGNYYLLLTVRGRQLPPSNPACGASMLQEVLQKHT